MFYTIGIHVASERYRALGTRINKEKLGYINAWINSGNLPK
jgi:hypothetical protein